MIPLFATLCLAAEQPEAKPTELEPVWTLVVPLGVPQLVQRRLGRGLIYGGLQLAGIGVATWSTVQMWQAFDDEDVERELQMRMVSAGSVAFASAGWFASVLDASNQYQQHKEMADRARDWERSRVDLVVADRGL